MRVFDEDEEKEFERRMPGRDRGRDLEVTLGGGTFVLLVCGLILLCGVCFGGGYLAGRRGSQPADADQAASGVLSAPAGTALPKPSAMTQPAAAQPAQSTPPDASQPGTGASDLPQSAAVTIPIGAGQGASPAGSPAAQPQVRPALPPQGAPQAPPVATARPVQAAPMPSAGSWMVQIAAVSHQEDADVLLGALRKRGYTVSARHDAADNLIHVRIGPFSTHDEAARWRMKLLSDGYNAMIQP